MNNTIFEFLFRLFVLWAWCIAGVFGSFILIAVAHVVSKMLHVKPRACNVHRREWE